MIDKGNVCGIFSGYLGYSFYRNPIKCMHFLQKQKTQFGLGKVRVRNKENTPLQMPVEQNNTVSVESYPHLSLRK